MRETTRRLDGKSYREWNEGMYIKYNNERVYFHPNPVVRYTENKRVNPIMNLLSPNSNDRVIELGCGEGYSLDKVKKGTLVGVDLSSNAIRRANEEVRTKENTSLILGDIQRIPVSSKSFDKIICTEVIEHVIDPRGLIEEIIRIARSDATIIVTIPNENLINRVKWVLKKLRLFDILLKNVPHDMNKEWHLHSFNLGHFKKISEGLLKIEEIRATPVRWFPISYIMKCSKIQTNL